MDHNQQEEHSPVDEYLGISTQVTTEMVRQYAEEGRISELSFELYKEAGSIVILCAHAYIEQASAAMSLARNQAICAGLLTRTAKIMIAVAQLSSGPERGEVIMALNRCIVESATNVRFLDLKNEDKFYGQFVLFGLAPERELYDLIRRNITARQGTQLNIETRMLASIHRVCSLSGVEVESVTPRHGDWGGSLRNRLEALGQPDAYVFAAAGSFPCNTWHLGGSPVTSFGAERWWLCAQPQLDIHRCATIRPSRHHCT